MAALLKTDGRSPMKDLAASQLRQGRAGVGNVRKDGANDRSSTGMARDAIRFGGVAPCIRDRARALLPGEDKEQDGDQKVEQPALGRVGHG
jgi:hypothetical protein